MIVVLLGYGVTIGYAHSDSCRGVKVQRPIKTSHIISYGVINARAVKLVKPDYPPAAMAVNARGIVEIKVLINEKGCVASVEAKSGHPFLIPASKKAALASQFEPVFLGRKPTKVVGVIVYNFVR